MTGNRMGRVHSGQPDLAGQLGTRVELAQVGDPEPEPARRRIDDRIEVVAGVELRAAVRWKDEPKRAPAVGVDGGWWSDVHLVAPVSRW